MRNVAPVIASLVAIGLIASASGRTSAQTAAALDQRTYVWFAKVVSLDPATKTLTVEALTRDAVARSVDQFKPGDKIMVNWDMVATLEADTVLYVGKYEVIKNASVDFGYVLPAVFVAADPAAKTITFKTSVPDSAVQSAQSVQPGGWLKVTAPMHQPAETARLTAIEASLQRPVVALRPKPRVTSEVFAPVTKITTLDDYDRAMKVVSGAYGATNKAILLDATAEAKEQLANVRATMMAVRAFWLDKKKDYPATIAQDSVAKMEALDKALSGADATAVAAAAKDVAGTCASCHGKYREQDPVTREYRIRPGTL